LALVAVPAVVVKSCGNELRLYVGHRSLVTLNSKANGDKRR